MHFEQAKKVLQLTDTRIRKFGSIDISTSREIHEAIFRFQAFQRLVIAHHAQEALTHLRDQTDLPLARWRARGDRPHGHPHVDVTPLDILLGDGGSRDLLMNEGDALFELFIRVDNGCL
jgi:hypothetical protein